MYNIKSRIQKTGICIILAVVGKKGGICIILRVECKKQAYALY